MMSKPAKEHAWLQQLVGEWTYESECPGKPGDPPMKFTGTESVRAIGELWTQGEGRGATPDGTTFTSFITLGYDQQKKRFVGTWVGSMMDNLWVYDGELNGNVLTLDTVGPNWDAPGQTAKYQERLEILDADNRVFASSVQGADGTWTQLMSMQYRRTK